MKKSELKSHIKEEVKKVLTTEATKDEVSNQKELNREMEKTSNLVSKMSQIKNVKEQEEDGEYFSYMRPFIKNVQRVIQSLEAINNRIEDEGPLSEDIVDAVEALQKFISKTSTSQSIEEQEEDEEDDWYKSKDEDGDKDKEPSKADLKKQAAKTKGVAKAKDELAILTREMKSLAKKYKEAKGAEKDKIVSDLKAKTKLKKELEAILDK